MNDITISPSSQQTNSAQEKNPIYRNSDISTANSSYFPNSKDLSNKSGGHARIWTF